LNRYISFSQINTYHNCSFQWFKYYVLKDRPYTPNEFLLFGTVLHSVIQYYVNYLYTISPSAVQDLDLAELFKLELIKVYKKQAGENGDINFLTKNKILELLTEGLPILEEIRSVSGKFFNPFWKFKGNEFELKEVEIKPNFYFKGYIDTLLYDPHKDIYYIYDYKTSLYGWKENKKKDNLVRAQLQLYKWFLKQQLNIKSFNNIETQYIILRRKLYENCIYPQKYISKYTPPSSESTLKNIISIYLNSFLDDCFNNDGTIIKKTYSVTEYTKNCIYCPFKSNNQCPRWNKQLILEQECDKDEILKEEIIREE